MRSTLYAFFAVATLALAGSALSGTAWAAGGGGGAMDTPAAKNADAYNLMGYATRKSGDATGSLQYYNQALAIDAKHLGAHEYVGEAYLMLDRPAEAEQHLARLDSLCVFGCAEHRMLKAAVANYKAGKKPTN